MGAGPEPVAVTSVALFWKLAQMDFLTTREIHAEVLLRDGGADGAVLMDRKGGGE